MRALSTFDDIFSVFPTVEGGVTLLSGLKDLFMPAASAYVTSYFLVFFVGALFGAVYQFREPRNPLQNGSQVCVRADM